MPVGSNLQEMENVVTKGAAACEPMSKAGSNASGVSTPGQTGNWDLVLVLDYKEDVTRRSI